MYASIFIPHFQVQALVRSEPELLEKALAVVDGVPPMLRVTDTNMAAIQTGVELGMTRLKVEHLYNVAIRQRSSIQEHSAHAALLDCAKAFSPRVEDTADDTVAIDLEGLDRLFGSYQQIATQIYDQTILIGLNPNVAVAANPDTAIHASRGFEGIVVVPRGTEQKRLAALPLEVLRPEPEFLETLQRWGIHTFGAFAKLPATKISERLGQDGVQLHKLARAAGTRTLNPYKESLRFEEVLELDHAIVNLEPLTFVLSRLIDQICRRLRVRNRATHEIHVKLDLDKRGVPPHERILKLPLPVCDPKLLVKLLMLDLESHPPKIAVIKVTAEAIPTRPRTVQNSLFAQLAPEPERLELTLARIAHVVGRENVGAPEVSNTHRPDMFRIKRFANAATNNHPVCAYGADTPPSEGGETSRNLHTLTFRQFRPALEATVQLSDGIPTWIAFQGLLGSIVTASGPWNSSGDWWRTDRWNREEWDVVIESRTKGFGMYRIYRDCIAKRWFAEGVYD